MAEPLSEVLPESDNLRAAGREGEVAASLDYEDLYSDFLRPIPQRTHIELGLWMGRFPESTGVPPEFRTIFTLCGRTVISSRDQLVVQAHFEDSCDIPSTYHLYRLANMINSCKRTGMMLVHCEEGLNRTGLVVALALMLEGMTAKKAIQFLRIKRHPSVLCNPDFERWLLQEKI